MDSSVQQDPFQFSQHEPGERGGEAETTPWLKLIAFDYVSDDGRVATVELTGELRAGTRAPSRPVLQVRRGSRVHAHRATRTQVCRQSSGTRRSGRRPVEIWTAWFKVPMWAIDYPDVLFAVGAQARRTLPLGELAARPLPAPPLAAVGRALDRFSEDVLPSRRQVTALASVVAFGASMSSAAIVAGGASARSLSGAIPSRLGHSTARTGTGTDTTPTPTTTTPTTTTPTSTTPTTPTTTSTTPATTSTTPAS